MRFARPARLVAITASAFSRAWLAREGFAGRARRLHEACGEIARSHGLAIRVSGEWPIGPAVIVANHLSYLDAIAIAAVLPCAPIAKSEVASWPIIGAAGRELGVIFVERDSVASRARALRRALVALRAGVPIVNFPEGTTTDGTTLLPFQRGSFGLARLAKVPIIPVALRCAPELAWYGDASFVPHYLGAIKIAAPALELVVGAPIDSAAPAEALAAHTHHTIAQLLRGGPLAPVIRLRVPAPRPDAVLPLAHGAW